LIKFIPSFVYTDIEPCLNIKIVTCSCCTKHHAWLNCSINDYQNN